MFSEPEEDVTVERLAHSGGGEHEVVQSVFDAGAGDVGAELTAVFLDVAHVKHPVATVMLRRPFGAVDALTRIEQQDRYLYIGLPVAQSALGFGDCPDPAGGHRGRLRELPVRAVVPFAVILFEQALRVGRRLPLAYFEVREELSEQAYARY